MSKQRHRIHAQRGFTLIELMISLVLFAFAVAGLLSVAVSLNSGFREQREAIGTEAAVRAAMDFLTDAMRGASPAMTTGVIGDLTVATGACPEAALEVFNKTNAPDSFTAVFAYGGAVTTTLATWNSTSTSITAMNVYRADDFVAGDTVLLTDGTTGHLFHVNAVDATNDVLTLAAPAGCTSASLPASYPAGTLAIRAMRARFYVDPNFDGQMTLMVDPGADGIDPEPLAENIEDMQVAIGIDLDSPLNGIQSAEWVYAMGPGALRALRITLVSRTQDPLKNGTTTFRRPPIEDRTAVAPVDGYRRRILTSVVDIRNMGGSPL